MGSNNVTNAAGAKKGLVPAEAIAVGRTATEFDIDSSCFLLTLGVDRRSLPDQAHKPVWKPTMTWVRCQIRCSAMRST
jgi:hypothetical protein